MSYVVRDGKTLKAARKNARMSQVQLAAASGLSQTYISAIEGGRMPLTNYAQTMFQTAIAEFVNARFLAMPAAQAQERRIKSLEKQLDKLQTKGIENLRDPLILGLERQIEKLTRERDHYKAIAEGKTAEASSEVEEQRVKREETE